MRTNYEHFKANHPIRWQQQTQGGTFYTDLAALYTRYRATPASTNTLPPALYQAVAAINITHHRTSNPLSYDQRLPNYSSTHPADQLFGANRDPLHTIWAGGSLVDIPTSTTQAHQALRWALASADYAEENHIPTCTVMLIPDTYLAPYKKLIHHPWIHYIDSRPQSELYSTSDTWLGSKLHTSPSTQKMHLIIVCNPLSETTYFPNLQEFITFGTTL
jgi:hypothetical protein